MSDSILDKDYSKLNSAERGAYTRAEKLQKRLRKKCNRCGVEKNISCFPKGKALCNETTDSCFYIMQRHRDYKRRKSTTHVMLAYNFPNGMVSAWNYAKEQMPEFQGKYSKELHRKILENNPAVELDSFPDLKKIV